MALNFKIGSSIKKESQSWILRQKYLSQNLSNLTKTNIPTAFQNVNN